MVHSFCNLGGPFKNIKFATRFAAYTDLDVVGLFGTCSGYADFNNTDLGRLSLCVYGLGLICNGIFI